jgi:hypothetical protein
MKVDINNLRKQASHRLDNVIRILNDGIMPETHFEYHDINGRERCFEGDILISKNDLAEDLDLLRFCIYTLLCLFESNNPSFKDIQDEVSIAEFNPYAIEAILDAGGENTGKYRYYTLRNGEFIETNQ